MFILEGNIGVGKSTFLKLLKQHAPSINVIQEPLQTWAHEKYGISLLENFYQKPSRWAYTMETLAMIYRSREHLKIQELENQRNVMERSIYSGHYCFALNGYKQGFFNEIEWDIYHQWVEFFFLNECKPPQGFIYLKADPNVCGQRIKKRNRAGEDAISTNYLEQIHTMHESFLIDKKDVFDNLKPVPVLTIDCNDDFENGAGKLNRHVNNVQEFILSVNT